MKKIILDEPEIALRFARLLFIEIRGADELQWFLPFYAEDEQDLWHVSGRGDGVHKRPPDAFHDQFENECFYMHVAKIDAEVKDIGVQSGMKLAPETKAQIRSLLQSGGKNSPAIDVPRPREFLPDISVLEMLRGGLINSSETAAEFGKILFEGQFAIREERLQNLRCEQIDGLWHVYAEAEGQSAELVFRRSNAQVLSLDLRSGK